MKPYADLSDQRVVKALAHPLRVQILGLLEHQTASPSELAAELRVPLGNVSYHVRQLQSFGLIRLVRTTPRRGSIEHHYELVARPDITDAAWDGAARHRQARDGRRRAGAARPARQGRRDGRRLQPPRGAPQPHGADARRRGLARGLRAAGRHVRPPRGDRAREPRAARARPRPSRRSRRSCSCITSHRRCARTATRAPQHHDGAVERRRLAQ